MMRGTWSGNPLESLHNSANVILQSSSKLKRTVLYDSPERFMQTDDMRAVASFAHSPYLASMVTRSCVIRLVVAPLASVVEER